MRGDQPRVSAHRAVLAARSAYFRAMLLGPFAEQGATLLRLPHLPAAGLRVVLRHLYTSVLALPPAQDPADDLDDVRRLAAAVAACRCVWGDALGFVREQLISEGGTQNVL